MKQGVDQIEPDLGFQQSESNKQDENNHGHTYALQARRAAQVGDIETLRFLLDNKLILADSTDSDDCSLLHWAAINNRIEVFLVMSNLNYLNLVG
jgi:ankyrin repeat protein